MSAPPIDRIIVEASPGEIRAVALAGDIPWQIAFERPLGGIDPGDIFCARAGAEAPGGGRFFEIADGVFALCRRPRPNWTQGAYGLVQVLRANAGDKGPRVTDRAAFRESGVAVSLGADGHVDDRIEIARRLPKDSRAQMRDRLRSILPDDVFVQVEYDVGSAVGELMEKAISELRGLAAAATLPPRRLHAAGGEIVMLAKSFPKAAWAPEDVATGAWLASQNAPIHIVDRPDGSLAGELDRIIAECMTSEVRLPGGGRLWIEPTHALTAIDVDLGSAPSPADLNVEAAREVARQMRLRRIGGIVAIDFLREGQAGALAALAPFAADDPWPWTAPVRADASGLVSFQRARLGASLAANTRGPEAHCLAGLRAAVRSTASGRGAAATIAGPPARLSLLRHDLRPALEEAEARLGRTLDLRAVPDLRSLQVIGDQGQVLDEA